MGDMGTSKSSQQSQSQQTSQLTPWAPATGALSGILGQLGTPDITGGPLAAAGISALGQIASQPNPLGGLSMNAAQTQLGGGANYGSATNALNDAYGKASSALSPYTSGSATDPSSNPALAQALATNSADVMNSVNPMFAAAGRLGSPDNYQAVARGITQGSAPIFQNAAGNQIQAGGMLGNLGASTASGLSAADATRAGIMGQGVNNAATAYGAQTLAPQAQIAAGELPTQLRLQNAGAATGILGPLAAMFGQNNGSGSTTQSGTQTASLMQDLLMGSQMFGNIFGGQGGGAYGNAKAAIFS